MAKQKREGKKYSYMDTYGDLVTLLLCFFVLLFAMSTVETARYNVFVQALTNRFGNNMDLFSNATSDADVSGVNDGQPTGQTVEPDPSLPMDLNQLAAAINEYIQENSMEGQVSVEQGENGTTFIRMTDNALFDGDSAALRPETMAFLDFLGTWLKSVEGQILQVNFNGHTGSIPGSSTDDWLLSSERAGRVSSYFANNIGFNRFKIRSMGYGRNYPIADNGTAAGIAKNRRVDIIIVGNEGPNLEQSLLEAMRIYFPNDDIQFFEGSPGDLTAELENNGSAEGDSVLDGLSEEQIRQLYDEANSMTTSG